MKEVRRVGAGLLHDPPNPGRPRRTYDAIQTGR